MFKKVLIANRGAIAVRICRTLRELGVTSVAVYSEADRHSLHRRVADEAWELGDGPASATYLNVDKLLAIMEEAGVEAVHPGYGFLSENAVFVAACEARGIAFIGPTPDQMEAFGLKHRARDLARENGVPLLEGTDLLIDTDQALKAAELIGYPVILKSTAGGGGIGMQICADADALRGAFDSVKRLGASNFSNDGVFLEKYISHARHIEVQIFGDGQGKAIALGERDCSAQRRNQKVIEECPAPGIPEAVRQSLHATAVRLVEAVNYRNAGTVEFIYDQDTHQFFFLEVNTRLQVEHGVTEQVYGVDLVAWMVRLAAGELPEITSLKPGHPDGWAIQARVYAEDPNKQFQPCAGLLTHVDFPPGDGKALRIDHWIDAGLDVPSLYDPMLAKVIAHGADREQARLRLAEALQATAIEGIETNRNYLLAILDSDHFQAGTMYTRYLNEFRVAVDTLDVLSAGTLTTVQDYPGRQGFWDVGVPPSGPFDARSFRLGNRLLGNPEEAAGLELTLNGPTLRFNTSRRIVVTGALMKATLDGEPIAHGQVVSVKHGQTLALGSARQGMRAYLLVEGGIQCQPYLGSRSTFTLGQFGGHGGRALRSGDVIHLGAPSITAENDPLPVLPEAFQPTFDGRWQLRVIYGPHGAPDFFTADDISRFFTSEWEVHYNSSRTGIRLIGPKPEWARSDGGEAGMHPSNIHDNAYAIGTVDFTGDMPVILGPDGPSLGGFVCPATVIEADLWKLGQLKPGDRLRFVPVGHEQARELAQVSNSRIQTLTPETEPATQMLDVEAIVAQGSVLKTLPPVAGRDKVVYRPSGDCYLLVEYGPLRLDIRLRFRVHALMQWLQTQGIEGLLEMTPGIRSLQIRYQPDVIQRNELLAILERAESELGEVNDLELPSRIVHLPLSWDDPQCQLAIEKYMQSVRGDAPWCPSNIEFIRRINGLESVNEVKRIVFEANYVVMGLGDVYLGAPVATPLDPRHRLVTTKYNPARTWTAENSVGIGGSYLCIYGMEGPGGYQFVGRTLQMWNRFHKTPEFEQPWLLRFFDQIRFYEVSAEELQKIREEFPRGGYPLKIEETRFRLSDYEQFLETHEASIKTFLSGRDRAFQEELERWVASGQINFEASQELPADADGAQELPEGCQAVESPVSGSLWKLMVSEGAVVTAGQTVAILESMKMEIPVVSPVAGTVTQVLRTEGQSISAGQRFLVIQEMDA